MVHADPNSVPAIHPKKHKRKRKAKDDPEADNSSSPSNPPAESSGQHQPPQQHAVSAQQQQQQQIITQQQITNGLMGSPAEFSGQERLDRCRVCGSSADYLCLQCRSVAYCSSLCQTKDWKSRHDRECKLFQRK
jgi:hypothetical protein